MNLEVITRAMGDLKARRAVLGTDGDPQAPDVSAEAIARAGFSAQSARQSKAAERLFLAAIEKDRKSGAAWYGLGSLLHECQHGGLEVAGEDASSELSRENQLSQAADAALIAGERVGVCRRVYVFFAGRMHRKYPTHHACSPSMDAFSCARFLIHPQMHA